MTRPKEEAREYQRGYNAGRKRVAVDQQLELQRAERELFRRQVFLAILPELVRAPWQTGDKTWKSMSEFVDGAWKFADLATVRTTFSGLTLAAIKPTQEAPAPAQQAAGE